MLLHYFIAGGIFMWGILLASICGVAVILEKLWIFSTKEREFTKEYRKQLFKALKTESREKIVEIVKPKRDSVATQPILYTILKWEKRTKYRFG